MICEGQSTAAPKRTLDFESLTKLPSLFVDKTMLLETLFGDSSFSSTDRRIISITTPRGFGRTTNLDMIARFAGIETSARGARFDKFNSSAYHIFSPGVHPRLAISRHEQLIRDHLSTYPVVYLDLANVTATTIRQTMRNLHERVKQSYRRYEWLEDKKLRMAQFAVDKLDHERHRKEWRFINKVLWKQLNAVDIHTSIGKLIRELAEQFRHKVVLLIDNYDAPIIDAVYHQSNTSVDQFYEFFNVFFSTTLDDSVNHTQLVVMTGTHPVSIKTRTEIDFYSFLSRHELDQFFGFTEIEVKRLLDRNSGSISMQDMRNYFGGYLANGSSTPLYHPASVIKFFNSSGVADAGRCSKVLPFCDPQIHKLVKKFMPNVSWEQDKGVEGYWGGRSFEITPKLEIDQLERITSVVAGNESATSRDMDTYFGILFANGYFTHPNGSDPDVVAFPNLQIMATFQKYLN